MITITKEDFKRFKDNEPASAYLLRCFQVGDEEQWQHDTNFNDTIHEHMDNYGVNEEDATLIRKIFQGYENDSSAEHKDEEALVEALYKYQGEWEKIARVNTTVFECLVCQWDEEIDWESVTDILRHHSECKIEGDKIIITN